MVSIAIWQTRDQAERSMKSFDKWIKEGAGQLVESVHGHVGELPFFAITSDPKPLQRRPLAVAHS